MSNRSTFTFEKRQKLEEALQKNLTISAIAKSFGISRNTLYKELKIGSLIEGDYFSYSATKAQAQMKAEALEEYFRKVQ